MKNIIFLFVALIITVTSCRKDIQIEDTIFIPIGEDVTTNLHGRIIDLSGRSIPEVEVTVKGKSIFTNGDGYFYMLNTNVPSDGFTIKVRSLNNDKILRRTVPQAETNTYEEIILEKSERFKEYLGTEENIITDSINQVKVTIPKNSLVTENNTPYNGIYLGRVKYYDPTEITTLRTMPGNMQGIDKDGEKVTLGSFGMFDIEITDPNGEQLKLADDKTARVTMESSALFESFSSVPTWRLDPDTGLWLEDKNAQLVNIEGFSFYVFDIDEFRYWNCDVRELNTYLSGTVVDEFGVPLENRLIQITFTSEGNPFFCTGGNTNNSGQFETTVPKNKIITFSIFDQNCYGAVHTEEIGPFTQDSDTKDIEAVITEDSYTITGFVLDCSGDISFSSVTVFLYDQNGVVRISTQTNEEGFFAIHNTCFDQDLEGGYRIGVLDLDTGNYIITDQYPFSEVDTDIGNILQCDDIIEFVNVVSGFGDLSFDNLSAFYGPDSLVISAETNNISFNLFANVSEEGMNPVDYLQILYSDDQVLTCTSAYQHTNCKEAIKLTITEINEDQKYITGSIEGVLYTGEIAEPDFTFSNDVSIEFKVLYQ